MSNDLKQKVKEWLLSQNNIPPNVIGVKINGEIFDLHSYISPPKEGDSVTFITPETEDGLYILRHSTAHIMASVVQKLYPGTKIAIGPAIEDGFYYDFDRPQGQFTQQELETIEHEMAEVVKQNLQFKRISVTKEEAVKIFRERGENYKLEIIEEIPQDKEITLYQHGDWIDLCAGPHLPDTSYIRVFKLLNVAGAYWRGDERNKMLSRIYGTAFFRQEELEQYLKKVEEAKERDHRRLGRELDLYSINEEVGPGLILWHPKGALIREIIETFWKRAHYKNGYQLVYTPHIGRLRLWDISGHNQFYSQYMYAPMEIEGEPYRVKPMNCPFHIQIYKSRIRSYRELPLRLAELGTVYRYEKSGQLHGLLRVRGFTQDDAHIFCTGEQLFDEIITLIKFSFAILEAFGFKELEVNLSTKPKDGECVGSDEDWERATYSLKEGLERIGVKYQIAEGEGAFYGPKIDIEIRDAIGRKWQCSTIQVDFNLPERFDLFYIDQSGGRENRPVMVHRAILGSLERFFGILIEHYKGRFPLWLAPVQAKVLTITDRQRDYGEKVVSLLEDNDIRVDRDFRSEKLGAKIRDARVERVPYILIVGDREEAGGTVAVRRHGDEDLGQKKVEELVSIIKNEGKIPEIKIK